MSRPAGQIVREPRVVLLSGSASEPDVDIRHLRYFVVVAGLSPLLKRFLGFVRAYGDARWPADSQCSLQDMQRGGNRR